MMRFLCDAHFSVGGAVSTAMLNVFTNIVSDVRVWGAAMLLVVLAYTGYRYILPIVRDFDSTGEMDTEYQQFKADKRRKAKEDSYNEWRYGDGNVD